jgi:filamentous hemagglutinin
MNQGIYKLVYSKVLNMLVPASEAARSCGSKDSKRTRKHARNSLFFVLIGNLISAGSVWADPVGLVPGTQAWVNASITGATSTSMTITQTAPKAILDWQKLNLNFGELLKFNQQGNRTWSALNRIHDLNPSILDGTVLADGNVYFINTNGIIFGKNAQFNVGSLYAGTLDITNDLFNSGFVNGTTFTNVFGDGITGIGGFVTVESGAQINAASGGKVLLFAPTVTNNGIINTPDGQTILAAGNKVYLQSSKDPAGFLVEVDSGGTATNLGKIVAERGNITMMGLAVNQSGTLTATTSVRANGSIHLLAQDKVNVAGVSVVGARNGIVTLTKDSVTEVNPEYANKEETIASQAFKTSDVKIEASLVNIDGTISAKGGNVTVNALNSASPELVSENPNGLESRIYLGDNATIDVSGVDAVAPMSRNQLEIQLFSDQLKDAPILRDTGLFKETVYVDARKGTQLFDIQPFLALKGATVAEKMTAAGKVTLSTPDTVITEKGSVINVSGGSTTYEAGNIKETNLYYNGKLVPISEAKPGIPYDKTADIYTVKDDKWGVTRSWDLSGGGTQGWGKTTTGLTEAQLKTTIVGSLAAGYMEGDDAGTLDVSVPGQNQFTANLQMAGRVLANTKTGTQQIINQDVPKGGKFIGSANDLLIAQNAREMVTDFTQNLPSNFQSSISTDIFTQGFNDIDLAKVDKLTVIDGIHLNANGKMVLNRDGDVNKTQINADIIAPGSNIKFGGTTTVADGVTISTAGIFTNDKAGVAGQYSTSAATNAGNIVAGIMNIGKNVTMDASAGAWVDNKGALHEGNAGNIKFSTSTNIDNSVQLQAYGFKKNGELSVAFVTPNNSDEQTVNVGGNFGASATDIDIGLGFFSKGAFSKYDISAFNVNIGGTGSAPELYAQQSSWRMGADFANQAGGQSMSLVASPSLQPESTRQPVGLSFSASKVGGTLTLAENTTIRTDRGGSVSLAAGNQVNVLGDIVTPSGAIDIKISDKDGSLLYNPAQAIFIGNDATLSARGSSVTLPDSQQNLLKTQVFNAGTISIDAPKGAVVMKEGAVLDVSGTSVVTDTRTLDGYTRETLYGDAGTIKVSASDGLLLDGTFKGASIGTGRGGSLELGFTNTLLESGSAALAGNREFTITEHKELQAQNFVVGDTLKNASGETYTAFSSDTVHAQISADQVEQGGFSNFKVKSFLGSTSTGAKDAIRLEDGLNVQVAGNLKFESPTIGVKNEGTANISASHITLKSPSTSVDNTSLASGNGKLATQSKQLFIDGLVAVEGVNETSLSAMQDISGKGTKVKNGSEPATQGGLVATGDIHLKARQIYPSTNAKLGFEAVGDGKKITVNSSGAAPKPALSAGGLLTLTADNIEQRGVLAAPFGQIDIIAKEAATFAVGSITSVTGKGQITPYGTTTTGGQVFNTDAGQTTPLVEKSVTVKSKNIDMQKGAVVDLSAGGDMFAYEWVQGIGGSQDVLAKPNTYAVIPNLGQDYAPIDQVYSDSSAQVSVGQSVYLTGVPGLASGYYTLLPARYALVPGAFMVQTDVAGAKVLPTQIAPQLDGATLTSGYFAELGTGARDANWSTFKVTNGSIFRPAAGTISKAPSQYIITSANDFFTNKNKSGSDRVALPQDVGILSVNAAKLALDGTVVANKVAGGAGLKVDVSSNNIRVVNAVGVDDGSLQLTAGSLNALNAESLLLGGGRKLTNGVEKVTTSAETISIENSSSNVIKTPEFIAAAKDSVNVKSGAAIDTGAASKQAGKTVIEAEGDGALLALSSKNDIVYSRTGGSPTSTVGELNIEAGSQLHAGNSVVLDSTKSASFAGNVTLQDGGSATLGANRILIGDAPIDAVGLNANAAALAALGQLKSLTLNSYNNIDTYGAVNFGNDKLNLTMNAAGIVGHLASGETVGSIPANAASSIITAKSFTLKNTQGAKFNAPVDSSERSLEINAETIKFDGKANPMLVNNQLQDTDKTAIAGFNKLDIKAEEVRVANVGELNLNVAESKLTTGRVTADTAADYKIKTTSKLEISPLANAKPSAEKGFGAKLGIQANDLTVASNIDLSSGRLALTATNDLNIATGANISATSTASTFYNKTVNASAGSVTLTSTTSNVNVNTGAVVDVSSQGEANSGLVKVVATNGTANINGDLKGSATGTGKGGVLDVDVKTLADLSITNGKAAGFSEARQYRVRTGDVNISGTGASALTARETMVSADAGKITVSGDIIATAPKNSRIGLFAGNGVALESTANLEAKSTKAGEEGGKVEIYTRAGSLDLKAGSGIDVSGGAGTVNTGEVRLRAPRTGAGAGNGVAVTNLATNIMGAKSTVLEAFKTFLGVTSVTAGNGAGATLGFDTVANDVNSFMGNKDNIVVSLGKAGDDSFHLRAGTEIQSVGNLAVNGDWNLYSDTRTGGEPSVLTLRAKDNITFNGSLSDGFTTATTAGVIGEGDSTSYRVVAGADYSAANLLSTIASAKDTSGKALTGKVVIANNKLIRTGTGDIDITAGGDLEMGTVFTAANNTGSVIYTAGRNAGVLAGFDLPTGATNYLTNGGDINIVTKGNIVGGESTTNNRQLINNWLYRNSVGSGNNDTSWWVRPDKFQQSAATLGGGDVNIEAGGNISNFSASAPTTGRFDTNGNTGNQAIDGGGDVKVTAGGNINNGIYFVAKGEGDIKAGAGIKKEASTVGTVLALQDGSFNVSADKDVFIQAVINPTLIGQSTGAGNNVTNNINLTLKSYFNTYSDTASVSVASMTGDVKLFDKFGDIKAKDITDYTGVKFLPSKLTALSLNGDLKVARDAMLLPSATGDLKLLAANNIEISNLTMSDADINLLPSIKKPSSGFDGNLLENLKTTHAPTLLHENDTSPVMVVAEKGGISMVDIQPNDAITLAKQAKFVAGKDIKNVTLLAQNNNASDITVLKAGNDILIDDTTLSGPGELLIQAGRNIDLSNTNARIATTGNSGLVRNEETVQKSNAALPSEGASITLQAGLGKGANVQGYIDQYILPSGAGPVALAGDATKLAEYRTATTRNLTDYMRKTTGNTVLTDAEALTQFNTLNLEAKTIFANRHLSAELLASGEGFAKAGNHNRGYDAIAKLFPTINEGDIALYKSKITTNNGGSVDLLAPGGLINVGVAGGASDDVGIITEKTGSIRAFANKGFEVNQSKVITQFGGDITVWSTTGTIDAGRGSKTATSIPERVVLTDADGNTTVEVKGVAAGSGIRAQSYDPDGPNGSKKEPKKGKVALIAPVVDAGEAGIEAGDLLLVAPIVLNATNIQVQGASSGVPIAATSSLAGVGAGLSPDSVNSATAAVAQSVAQSVNQPFVKPTLPSIISVDVISIGN